jgi:hypothetical protein
MRPTASRLRSISSMLAPSMRPSQSNIPDSAYTRAHPWPGLELAHDALTGFRVDVDQHLRADPLPRKAIADPHRVTPSLRASDAVDSRALRRYTGTKLR